MAKRVRIGDTVTEMFCLPDNSTLADTEVYTNGSDVSGSVTTDGPDVIAAGAGNHGMYKMTITIPAGAVDRQVYTLIQHWKDPSGDLQCPIMFDLQVEIPATSSTSIEVIGS